MDGGAMRSVGVDIGSSSIKVVEASVSAKGLVVHSFLEHPLNQGPGADNEVVVLEFLQSLQERYSPDKTKFIFGLKQEFVSVRHKVFPFTDRHKILKSLPFELEEDLPFSPDSAQFDAKIIRFQGPTAEVLACATPRHRLESQIQILKDAGFELNLLSAEGVAFANCFEKWNFPVEAEPGLPVDATDENTPKRSLNLKIHIGASKTLVLAFEGDHLLGVRTVLWGSRSLVETVAREYEIPFIEALKEVENKSFILTHKTDASYDQVVFSDTITASIRELCKEIKITALEFSSELGGEIRAATISGGGSKVRNLNAAMTQLLEIPVNTEQFSMPIHAPAEFDAEQISKMGIALGLAIEGLKKPRNAPLNFLKGDFAPQNHALQKAWEIWKPFVQVGLGLYVVFFIYSSFRQSTALSLSDKSLEVLKAQGRSLAGLSAKNANEAGIKKYIREQRKRVQELEAVASAAQLNSAMDLLKKTTDLVPGKSAIQLDVKSWSLKEDLLTISGFVANSNQINAISQSLANLAVDGKVNSSPTGLTAPAGKMAFGYSLRVDRGVRK
jgi:general secretion pathway protein L